MTQASNPMLSLTLPHYCVARTGFSAEQLLQWRARDGEPTVIQLASRTAGEWLERAPITTRRHSP
jgi:hypothetical protein